MEVTTGAVESTTVALAFTAVEVDESMTVALAVAAVAEDESATVALTPTAVGVGPATGESVFRFLLQTRNADMESDRIPKYSK